MDIIVTLITDNYDVNYSDFDKITFASDVINLSTLGC